MDAGAEHQDGASHEVAGHRAVAASAGDAAAAGADSLADVEEAASAVDAVAATEATHAVVEVVASHEAEEALAADAAVVGSEAHEHVCFYQLLYRFSSLLSLSAVWCTCVCVGAEVRWYGTVWYILVGVHARRAFTSAVTLLNRSARSAWRGTLCPSSSATAYARRTASSVSATSSSAISFSA